MMKRSVIGILAHVDAGKTTLSEAMLYTAGSLRVLGRVDHGDAFLDTFSLERQRGITIFSKQAVLQLPELKAILLDTPGHVDFSAEMERTLDVLDCAILVVSGSSGVQSHTRTVWKLLRQREIPVLLFVNKMDLPGTDREEILRELKQDLSSRICDLSGETEEEIALCDEKPAGTVSGKRSPCRAGYSGGGAGRKAVPGMVWLGAKASGGIRIYGCAPAVCSPMHRLHRNLRPGYIKYPETSRGSV